MFQSRSYIKLELKKQAHSGPIYQIVSYMQYFSAKFAHDDVYAILFLLLVIAILEIKWALTTTQ
jgi:hypothetical protein